MKTTDQIRSQPFIERHPSNPILDPSRIPYLSSVAYNAGVARYKDGYVMVFRNDYHYNPEEQKANHFQLGLAFSDDGIDWRVEPRPLDLPKDSSVLGEYDPHISLLEGRYYLTYAHWGHNGYQGITAVTDDFRSFEIVDRTPPENRDVTLFPEKIGGRYFRLDRPQNVENPSKQSSIWISESPDLVYWGKSEPLLRVEEIPFANMKLGGGAPPVRTEAGWLVLYHAVEDDPSRGKNGWEETWTMRYTIGAMLLDLENPRRKIAVATDPLMVPEAKYETEGSFRNDVLFPGALLVKESGEARIYYGAADTVECVATAKLSDIVDWCLTYR